ncbi:MAG: hypothetical protein ACFE9I_11600 [Candidatus Hermodarchaeota archaeon]
MKKTSRLLTLATLGIFIFSFIFTGAASEGRVTKRPIEDWLDPNYAALPWGEENWAFSDFFSPYSYLVCKMGFPWPKAGAIPWFVNDMVYENSLVIGDTIINGHITERELKDGTALIILQIDVKNAPLTVYDFFDFMFYCYGWTDKPQAVLGDGEDGYVDYKVVVKFIIPEPGAELPNVFDIWYPYISCNIHGIGYGTLTERAVELGFAETAGAPGMVEIHQNVLYKPDLKEGHPKYDPSFGDLYPVEIVEVYELS